MGDRGSMWNRTVERQRRGCGGATRVAPWMQSLTRERVRTGGGAGLALAVAVGSIFSCLVCAVAMWAGSGMSWVREGVQCNHEVI
eukprot:448535-Prymnesium_polylepis.1